MTISGHIFVSHSVEDRARVDEIVGLLEARGIQIWIAPRDIRPGSPYPAQTQEAIEQCAGFIVIVTEASNRSDFVPAETEMAFSLRKPIFPVRFAEVRPQRGLGLFIGARHWTDAFGPVRDGSLERLVRELEPLAGTRPAAEARPPAPARRPAPEPVPPPGPAHEPVAGRSAPVVSARFLVGGAVAIVVALVILAIVNSGNRTSSYRPTNSAALDAQANQAIGDLENAADAVEVAAYDRTGVATPGFSALRDEEVTAERLSGVSPAAIIRIVEPIYFVGNWWFPDHLASCNQGGTHYRFTWDANSNSGGIIVIGGPPRPWYREGDLYYFSYEDRRVTIQPITANRARLVYHDGSNVLLGRCPAGPVRTQMFEASNATK